MLYPVKVIMDKEFGLFRRGIYGFNVFTSNYVDLAWNEDPRTIFLKTVCSVGESFAHTGNLHDFAATPEEIFGPPGKDGYYTVPVGIYSGEFYDAASWPNFSPCLFTNPNEDFWNMGGNTKYNMLDVLGRDAIAFYINLDSNAYLSMNKLFENIFISHEKWINSVTAINRLVIVSGSDGLDFEVYAREEEDFDLISDALVKATARIENDEWYVNNVADMEWDWEYNMCLMKKSLKRSKV